MKSTRNLGLRILALVLVFIMFLIPSVYSWWNLDWEYRQEINYSTTQNTLTGYQILLPLNSTNVGSEFDWSNSCDDLRFVTNEINELDYWIESCNTTAQTALIWIESDAAINTSQNYSFEMYYGNSLASSNSNVSNTFRNGEIFLITGDCTGSDCAQMDNNAEADNIRAGIGTTYVEDGRGYVNQLSQGSNPYGDQNNFYMRYRFLFVADTTGSHSFGTRSDDGSEAGIWTGDGYGTGIRTPTTESNHDIVTDWYGGHSASGTCGSTAATERSRILTSGQGYWIDYLMTENTGDEDAEMCIDEGSGYDIVSDTNFPNQIFARNYVTPEPTLAFIGMEEFNGDRLNISVNNPSILATNYILQNNTIVFNTSILCIGPSGSTCGEVTANLQYNSSMGFDNISTSQVTPFWTLSSQPQSCILDEGESCDVTWVVNATGTLGDFSTISTYVQSNMTGYLPDRSENITVRIVDGSIVAFNRSSYTFLPFDKNSGDRTVVLSVVSNIGDNTNITVECESGDCLTITENFIDGINLLEGNTQDLTFTCDDSISGTYSAIFNVTSNEHFDKSLIAINCEVLPVFGPLSVDLLTPLEFTNTEVRQNTSFILEANVSCNGTCGNLTAYATYDIEGWFDISWSNRLVLNYTLPDNIPTNFQILARLNSSDVGNNFDWSNNCSDVRFVDSAENVLDHYIEECDPISEELAIWFETQASYTSNAIFFMYYGNDLAVSTSSASNTFRIDEIYYVAGSCPISDTNCNYMDNNAEADYIRSNINNTNFEIDGVGYLDTLQLTNNPFGPDDDYYLRFRGSLDSFK